MRVAVASTPAPGSAETGALVTGPLRLRWPCSGAGGVPALLFSGMPDFRFAAYFEQEVLRKRPYLQREWCVRVVQHPVRVERQEDNRYRFWAALPELEGRYLRVVTLEDRTTIHNAFPDRGFTP